MSIAPFGIATLFAPFVFGLTACVTRRKRRLFWTLIVLTALATVLALVTILSIGGHAVSTSWSS